MHENQGLQIAIGQEKKRRQRGKRLNLVGDEEDGKAQFYSPQRIRAAKAYLQEKERAAEEDRPGFSKLQTLPTRGSGSDMTW